MRSIDLSFHQIQTMESLKDCGFRQELKLPLLHTDKINQGTPCIERIEPMKIIFSINKTKDEENTRQDKSVKPAAIE